MVMKGKILLSEKMHTDRYGQNGLMTTTYSQMVQKKIYLYIYRDRQIKNI